MLLELNLSQISDTRMEDEIKYPEMDKPEFIKVSYDYRNMEDAGKFRGVGMPFKMGSRMSTSIDAAPPEKHIMKVPRDHQG